MKNSMKRFVFVSSATIIGIALVLVFVFLGKQTSGPISGALDALGKKIIEVEQDYLLSQREPIRSKELAWFQPYRNNIELMKNPDTIFLGVYENNYLQSFDKIINLDESLQYTLPLIQIYTAWGDKDREKFPAIYAKTIYDLGSMPVITWEPWLNDFDREKHKLHAVADPNVAGMSTVARGDYDFYIEEWAHEIAAFEHNIFIRFGHEMNDPYRYPWGPQNNEPKDFVAAWQHVVNKFRELGVENVIWIWAPQPAYLRYAEYYPGDEYVDWIGVGTLNYGTVAAWSKWWTFKDIYGNYYDWLDMLDKPMMITEMGCLRVGGNREEWFRDALTDLPAKYPRLKAIILFNDDDDKTTLNKSLNWSIINDTSTCEVIRQTIKDTW